MKPNLYDKVLASIKQHKPKALESGLVIPKEIKMEESQRVHIVQIRSISSNPSTLEYKIVSTTTSYDKRTWLELKKHLPQEKYYVIHDPSILPEKKKVAKKKVEEVKEEDESTQDL